MSGSLRSLLPVDSCVVTCLSLSASCVRRSPVSRLLNYPVHEAQRTASESKGFNIHLSSTLYQLRMHIRHDTWEGEQFHTYDVWSAPRGR